MLHKIRQGITRLRSQLFLDLGDYRRSVFLAGTGRSGTTWVQEIINHDNSYRIMFEPFHSRKIGALKDWNYRQYLRGDNRDEKFIKPASAILSGRIRHEWIDRYNQKVVARKRLIKDIRAQLLLEWIKRNFPEIPIMLLMRHPCAVANSKLKLNWDSHLDDFLAQKQLMLDFLNPFQKEIESATTPFDKHVFMWCIENYVPLRQFSENEILVLFYEHLCINPQEEARRLFSFIGASSLPRSLNYAEKPSALSRKESAIVAGADLVDSWREHISAKQIARAKEICSIFGMQAIYAEDSRPLLSGNSALSAISN